MTHQRGPAYRANCPFYVVPTDPLSAQTSIDHCVDCACGNNSRLVSINEDLRQIAFLTIIEETPKYNPDHPSGASYTTFIKAKVCTRLWKERSKELREIPYTHQECPQQGEEHPKNPLMLALEREACAIESMADNVIQQIEVEFLRNNLVKLIKKLSDKEQQVIQMKFFEDAKGVEIAKALNITEARVTQLTKSALEKLLKEYIKVLDTQQGNPYRFKVTEKPVDLQPQ